MTLLTLNHPFQYEMECVARLFFPGEKIVVLREGPAVDSYVMETAIGGEDDSLRLHAAVETGSFHEAADISLPASAPEQERERVLATMLFGLLVMQTAHRPPWGILTGVRPVRLCRVMGEKGLSEAKIREALLRDYLVQPEKADLALSTGRNQAGILGGNRDRDFSLYISIPFCPSRCLYCSFVSHEIGKCAKLIPDYVALLCRELEETAAIAKENGLRLRTVYMGGGTPTTLEACDLDRILSVIEGRFDLSSISEYTVEAGRPDTITVEKLAVLRRHGVDRISINPQTMEDSVLRAIGRSHTAREAEESFALARAAGFSWINMDLIAGLPGDTDGGFSRTLDKVLALSPENITVHALTVKRSSTLRGMEDAYTEGAMDLPVCIEASRRRLQSTGYRPFYLYRQKGTRQNLENVGYALPGFESPYNITVMDEVQTVLAVGAGAVTKLCGPGNTVQRVCNHKYPYEYIGRFEELLQRKSAIGAFYEHERD